METGTLSSKGQITIPKKIRDFLHIQESEKVIFIPLEEGKVLITTEQKSASSIFGILKHRKRETPASIEQMDSEIKKRRLKRGVE